jgi:PAS domain-containing protein
MGRDAVLILDIGGKIVWANRNAHDNVGLRPGGLIGQNYLEFCPPDTHADLLRLHKLKIEGKTVRFRFDLGHEKVIPSPAARSASRTASTCSSSVAMPWGRRRATRSWSAWSPAAKS